MKDEISEIRAVLEGIARELAELQREEAYRIFANTNEDGHEWSYLNFACSAVEEAARWVQAILEVREVPDGERDMFEPSWLKSVAKKKESMARRRAREYAHNAMIALSAARIAEES